MSLLASIWNQNSRLKPTLLSLWTLLILHGVSSVALAGLSRVKGEACDIIVSSHGNPTTLSAFHPPTGEFESLFNLSSSSYLHTSENPSEQMRDALKLDSDDFLSSVVSPLPHGKSSVEDLMRLGFSHNVAINTLFGAEAERMKSFFDPLTGKVRLDMFPQVGLALENGRQKLDFIRIHYVRADKASRRPWQIEKMNEAVVKDYIHAMQILPNLKLVILDSRRDGSLQVMLDHQPYSIRNRVKIKEVDGEFSDIWAQDGSKPTTDPGVTLSLEDRSARYENTNRAMADSRAAKVIKQSLFDLEGGDIIVGDRHVLVGSDQVEKIERRYHLHTLDAINLLSHIFKKPVIVPALYYGEFGTELHPWSMHIDLDMVLAIDHESNREVALLRSPIVWLEKLSGIPISEAASERELRTVRDLILSKYEARAKNGELLPLGTRNFIWLLGRIQVRDIRYDILASRLMKRFMQAKGYRVIEMPSFGAATLSSGERPNYFFGTNAILSERTALVPSNGFPELDRAIKLIYNSLGYTVVPMNSARETICFRGGIRCASEVYRKAYVPPADHSAAQDEES